MTSPLVKALIDAGRRDAPADAEAKAARVLDRLGVGAGTAPATATAPPAKATTANTPAAGASKTMLVRLGIGTSVVSALSIGIFLASRPGLAPPAANPARAASSSADTPLAAPAPVAEPSRNAASNAMPGVPTVSFDDLPRPATPAPIPAPRARPDISQDDAPDGLREELALIESARRAIAGGRAAEAIARVDEWQQRFPRGVLGEEAAFLRIDALAQSGRSSEAKTLALSFLRAHPSSTYAPRVRRAVGLPAGEEEP